MQLPDFPTFLVLATITTGLIWLIDSLLFAPRRKSATAADGDTTKAEATNEPIIVEYSRSFFPVILVVLLLRSFLVEPFRIPSGSMMPTLLVGDFILVNKYIYGLRLPMLNQKVMDISAPERGDVIVFRYPENPSIDYIKRVIGIPGDVLEYRNKTVYINGKAAPQIPVGLYDGVGSGSRETGSFHAKEQLGKIEHAILIRPLTPDMSMNCNFLPTGPIPTGHYFVMGDNRDNSNDSRCWGLVPETNLVGKAIVIWMNWDSYLSSFIDWRRIGRLIY